jgi:hypothetical protein
MARGTLWWGWIVGPAGSGLVLVALLVTYRVVPASEAVFGPSHSPVVISVQYLWLAAIAGVALAGLACIRQSPSPLGWPDLLVPAVAVPLVVWWVLDRGMVHIGGYDDGLLANCGWLQVQRMRPHVDFPCTLCPHFYLAVKYAFLWFGVAWRSVVILAAIYAAVSFTWVYFLLRATDLPRITAALIALLAQSLCLMMGCYFWYNSVAAADATILVLAALAWADRPRSGFLFASITVALALVLLDKPNGWLLPACLAVGFFASREHRLRFLGCVAGAVGIVMAVAYLGPFDVAATLRVYSRLSETRPPGMDAVRRSLDQASWHAPVELGKLTVLLATFLTVAAVTLVARRSSWRTADGRWWARLWAYAGALAFGAASFFTNIEVKCMDLAVPTVAFAVWLAKCDPHPTTRPANGSDAGPRRAALTFGIWLCLFGLFQEVLHSLVRRDGSVLRGGGVGPTDLAVPVIALALWFAVRRPKGASALLAGCALAGALALAGTLAWTGYKPNWTDSGVLTLALAAGLEGRGSWKSGRFNTNLRRFALLLGVWFCLFSLCQGLFNGWTRYRVFTVCLGFFWEPEVSDERPLTPFMAGVRGGPRLVRVMKDLDAAVNKHRGESIFFGPWIEFAYPAFGVKPPAGFPVWWHEGTSYFPENTDFVGEAIRTRKIDVLILLKGNFYHMPAWVQHQIAEQYTADTTFPTLNVYLPRK